MKPYQGIVFAGAMGSSIVILLAVIFGYSDLKQIGTGLLLAGGLWGMFLYDRFYMDKKNPLLELPKKQ
jgi:hypothetical protein